jgi:hypothetical protein
MTDVTRPASRAPRLQMPCACTPGPCGAHPDAQCDAVGPSQSEMRVTPAGNGTQKNTLSRAAPDESSETTVGRAFERNRVTRKITCISAALVVTYGCLNLGSHLFEFPSQTSPELLEAATLQPSPRTEAKSGEACALENHMNASQAALHDESIMKETPGAAYFLTVPLTLELADFLGNFEEKTGIRKELVATAALASFMNTTFAAGEPETGSFSFPESFDSETKGKVIEILREAPVWFLELKLLDSAIAPLDEESPTRPQDAPKNHAGEKKQLRRRSKAVTR